MTAYSPELSAENVEIMRMDERLIEYVKNVDESSFVVRMIQISKQSRQELKHFIMRLRSDSSG